MNGEGNVLIDVIVTVLAAFATLTQVLCVRREWSEARCVNLSTLLRLSGWFVFTVRFSILLAMTGDLPIGVPSLVALIGLAMAEITIAALQQPRK